MSTQFGDFCRYIAITVVSGVVTLAFAVSFIDAVWWGRIMHDLFMFANVTAFCRYVLWRERFR